jgi:hypothetical protein
MFISFHSHNSCQNLLNLLPCTIPRYTPSCGVRAVGLWRHNAKHGLVVDAQDADCSVMLPYRFDIQALRYWLHANVASEIPRYPHLATHVVLPAALHATVSHWLDYYERPPVATAVQATSR